MPHVDLLVADEIVSVLRDLYEKSPEQLGVVYRVDELSGSTADKLLAIILEYGIAACPQLCVRETVLDTITKTETNPHYHGFMFIEKGRYAALRQAMKRVWCGNKEYSLKKADPEKTPQYFNYLCKGAGTGSNDQPHVFARSKNLSDDLISVCHSLYWKNKAEIQVNTKKRKRSIHEEILLMCQQRQLKSTDRKAIFQVIKLYYCKRIKYLMPSYLRNLVFQTSVYLDPDGPAARDLETYCISYPFAPQ